MDGQDCQGCGEGGIAKGTVSGPGLHDGSTPRRALANHGQRGLHGHHWLVGGSYDPVPAPPFTTEPA